MIRYFYILPALLSAVSLSASAQTSTKNYVMTETFLDANATRIQKTVQYYDGLGRPSVLAEGGVNPQGKYLYSAQTYDGQGRPHRTTLQATGTTSPSYMTPAAVTTAAIQSQSDNLPYSETGYDALGRVTFVSTPGQAWTGKGHATAYVTNTANSVKRYTTTATGITPTQNGYYPAGSLTGETITDENGIAMTVWRDLQERVVMEHRGSNEDTYYVYAPNGLLRFVLQPMYQESAVSDYRFRYDYDSRGHVSVKYLPGGGIVRYLYDCDGRLVAMCDPRLQENSRWRFFLYDGLGRQVIQGTCSSVSGYGSKPALVSRQLTSGTQILSTGYRYLPSHVTASSPQLELVTYYDDYTFVNAVAFKNAKGSHDFTHASPVCATSLPTGDITVTSDGLRLARIYYYDSEGRVIDTRQTLLDGDYQKTTTTYSFTGNPLTVAEELEAGTETFTIQEQMAYHNKTDRLQYHDVTYGGTTTRVNALTYDAMGRLSSEQRGGTTYNTTYGYDLHGWPTAITSKKGTTTLFSQNLEYNYNGNVSASAWNSYGGANRHGYHYTYDGSNRLTSAIYSNETTAQSMPNRYSETVAYNRNGSVTSLTRTGNSLAGYGNMDQLTYTYAGNRLKAISDAASPSVYDGAFEFVNGANVSQEYYYYSSGDLKYDRNKGIALVSYDLLGHPVRIQMTNGDLTEYVYAADGRKLREKHTTAIEGLLVGYGSTLELTPATTLSVDSAEYASHFRIVKRDILSSPRGFIGLDYHFDGGYLDIVGNFVSPTNIMFIPSYHYYFCDHQGNTRVVANGSGAVKQVNEYYPYGVSWGDASTYQGFQKFKYNGKELDRMHGLFWYDYGARRYDPAVGMFTQVDPLCEQYPHLNPYLYCAGNPVRYVDPDGRHIKVKKDKEKEGLYTILGGEVDDDLNIYDVSNGWENRISIGKALTQFSFFNDDGRPVEGSIINLNDKSGLVFWSNFEKWAAVMPLGYYALNAYKSQKYDFKRQGEPYPGTNVDKEEKENQKYHNRGMILNVDGKAYIASGRDIGNYAAGYYAGLIGLTWQESRFGFNALESIQKRRITAEKNPSQSAQFKGFTNGWKKQGIIRRVLFYKLSFP